MPRRRAGRAAGTSPGLSCAAGARGLGLAGRGGEARGWTWADPRCPGRGLGSRDWPGTRGRCWEAGSRSAATRATAASMRACACSKRGRAAVLSVCPPLSLPQLGNPSPGPGGEATSPRRPGVSESSREVALLLESRWAAGGSCSGSSHRILKDLSLSFLILGFWPNWARVQYYHLPLLTEEEREKG